MYRLIDNLGLCDVNEKSHWSVGYITCCLKFIKFYVFIALYTSCLSILNQAGWIAPLCASLWPSKTGIPPTVPLGQQAPLTGCWSSACLARHWLLPPTLTHFIHLPWRTHNLIRCQLFGHHLQILGDSNCCRDHNCLCKCSGNMWLVC